MASPRIAPERSSTGRSGLRVAEALVLIAALISFGLSVGLWFTESRTEALFVGLWVPSVLSLGTFYFARHRGGG